MATSEVSPINANKLFKIDLVPCLTIWFSVITPTIHRPDLLGSPSDLTAFHKSLGLPIHSLSLFSKNSLSTWSLVFRISEKVYPRLLVFLKSHYQLILNNSFWFFYSWLALLRQWSPLVSEWSISIIHIVKLFILRKINFNQSFFITINSIVFERTECYLLMTTSFYSGNFSLYSKLVGDQIIRHFISLSVLLCRESLPECDRW